MILKMITRKNELTTILCLFLSFSISESQDARSYDRNDWIPIHQPGHNIQKKATGRVLTLPDAAPIRFFPEEYRNTRQAEYQQYLRETSGQTKQRPQQHRQQQKQPFTPQQLEQYYIDQRKKFNEQRNLQALQDQRQYDIAPSKPYNNVKTQSKLLKQTYETLPTEFLPPPNPQAISGGLTHHYIFPSNPEGVPVLSETPPHQQTFNQFVQQPPGANGTVDFYNSLNQNYQANAQNHPIELTTKHPAPVKEDVQLLYLPVEQIQQKDFQKSSQNNQETLLRNIQSDFIQQALHAHKLQQQFEHGLPTPQAIVRKRKPHQPPLSVYMTGKVNAQVTDVVRMLKNAKKIDVQDTIGPDSPHVFVGPANLNIPTGMSRFDLPYLSNIESNRVERKVDQLAFFVAPLNYKTLPGYEKIPFPPPHVGSVIINTNMLGTDGGEGDGEEDYVEEIVTKPTKRPSRQRHRNNQHRTTETPTVQETASESDSPIYNPVQQTSYNSEVPLYRNEYKNDYLPSTSSPGYQKPIDPQTQFNQNKYVPGISLEQLREYQVNKENQEVDLQPPTPTSKQYYNYLETSTEDQRIYNTHDASLEKRKQKPIPEVKKHNQPPYDQNFRSTLISQPTYNQAVQSTTPSTTPQPLTTQQKYEEFIRLVKVAEDMYIRPQSNDPPPKNLFGEIPPLVDQFRGKHYLPQPTEKLNYDQLFNAPFSTNSEVNQINSAVKPTTSRPDSQQGKHVQLKYVVLEEYPVKITPNVTTTPEPDIHENINKFHRKATPTPIQETEEDEQSTQQIIIIKPQSANINDLVDPSIRQLLTPSLLAPTEKPKAFEPESIVVTQKKHYSTSTTTEEPTEAFTTISPRTEVNRIRTRGRGGARYTDRTTTYSPRRHPTRIRTRTRYSTTTTEAPERDYREYELSTATPRTVPTRQRLRSRGKPMISQGYSSTVSNVQHVTEPSTIAVKIIPEELKEDVNPYTEQTIIKPQLITRSKALSPEEEYLITKYNLPPFLETKEHETENIAPAIEKESEDVEEEIKYTTPKKTEDPTTVAEHTIRSTHKTTERPERPRIRQRIRGRVRSTTIRPTTTSTTTAEPQPQEDASRAVEEFYGFFRKPNFKSTLQEEPTTTPKTIIELKDETEGDESIQIINQEESTNKPIQFIGEILPKYTTTEKYFEITPEPSPVTELYVMTTTPSPTTSRRRRGRYTTRKSVEHVEEPTENQSVNHLVEEKPIHNARPRGKAHFKFPLIVTTDGTNEDNYPALYLKAQHDQESYTPQTSTQTEKFQITVDPSFEEEEGDQEQHASVISTKFAVPDNQLESNSNPKALKYVGEKDYEKKLKSDVTTENDPDVEVVTNPNENTAKPKKKGYWKLVKRKHQEEFEEAESQNIGIRSENTFELDEKHKITFETELNNFEEPTSTVTAVKNEEYLSTVSPNDEENVTEENVDLNQTSLNPKMSMEGLRTSTSTSTEISGDAEICSRGVCVKSDDYSSEK